MIYSAYNNTDDFMFRSFSLHSNIFHQKNLDDYFMISSGTNQFSMPDIWKSSICKEIESDFLYRWYTSSEGFQCITSAVKIYEDYISSEMNYKFIKTNRKVCMTTGGSGAAAYVFEFLANKFHDCTVVSVGMNYSLYERLSNNHNFTFIELCSEQDFYRIPEPECFTSLKSDNKLVFVFSLPNNPTGESYDAESFSKIVSIIKELNGFVIMDYVCDIAISKKPLPFLRKIITQHDYWNSCAVVNSFSKSDAVAGIRIGYIYGTEEIIDFCSRLNAASIMNPPTFPAFAVVLTCMFRCIFIDQNSYDSAIGAKRIISLFRKLFYITSAVVPLKMKLYADMVFDNAEATYRTYVLQMLGNENVMKQNISHTINTFQPYISHTSKIDHGFNFCIWFSNKLNMDEISLVRELIANTGVAILTESSFTLRKVNPENYFIRFSTACDENQYLSALLRMKSYMEKEVFRI